MACGTKCLQDFFFLDIGDILCFAGINFYDYDRLFLLLGINFCDFTKYPVPSIDNFFVFIEYMHYKYIFSNNNTVEPVFLCIPLCF